MKTTTYIFVALSLFASTQSAQSQQTWEEQVAANQNSFAGIICGTHLRRMITAIDWRERGIPVGEAERLLFSYDSEEDTRTRLYLREFLRDLYANPAAVKETYIDTGIFLDRCMEIKNGY